MTEETMEQEREEILRRVDKFTKPGPAMSRQDAANWIADLADRLDQRVAALYEEMDEEAEDA